MLRAFPTLLAAVAIGACVVAAAAPQQPAFLGVDDVHAGMVGVGRTVFAGDVLEDFTVHIIGTLHNATGPGRNLILAKLDGGPLATAGVIQGMSGSPVYIDGKLVGAVAYSLGSFPKEPFAGITPIAEMIDAVDASGPRRAAGRGTPASFATAADVFTALRRLTDAASAPLGPASGVLDAMTPSGAPSWARDLRPISAALFVGGADPAIAAGLERAFSSDGAPARSAQAPRAVPGPLRPGDPVGVSLVRGDLEMGATGTVTHVAGTRVYGFGHPFLDLGPTTMSMTRAEVLAVLPSLDSSMKIATMGPVIGTLTQDRATAIGGTLGAGPRELAVTITLTSDHAPDRRFSFFVLQDPQLTPLFSFVSVLNALSAYERQVGILTLEANGSVSFGASGRVTFDDIFAGDGALTSMAAAVTSPIGVAAVNEFRPVLPESLDLNVHASEVQVSTTIERAWLDTTRPHFGDTCNVQVLLRDYRGGTETVSVPVTMPAQASGPLTLLVSDAATLSGLEQRELKPAKPASLEALFAQLNATRRNNRLYLTLLRNSPGSTQGGQNLPSLPPSAQSVLDADKSAASTAIPRSVAGSWERRLTKAVRGSRELIVTLTANR